MYCKKVGILGGTFDPIHNGHLSLAQEALEENDLDEVIFLPAGIPNFKQDQEITPPKMRLEMVKKAIESNPKFSIDTRELFSEEVTYTYETMQEIVKEKEEEIFFIIGEDSMITLETWYQSKKLKKLVYFLVARRSLEFNTEKLEELKGKDYKIDFFKTTFLDLSSTDIRKKVKQGKSIEYLVPKKVYEMIIKENLYEK